MNFYRNHVRLRGKSRNNNNELSGQHKITLEGGQVQESSHWTPRKGDIDMSELTFNAETLSIEEQSTSIQSFLDIAVFEVQRQCKNESCDISKYGVGKIDTLKNVDLCENGRLRIDNHVFQGFHTQLMIPSTGPMPHHVKHKKIALPHKEQMYKVLFANCNKGGRKVQITGQAVLEYNENQVELSFGSVASLTVIALSICLFFTFLTVRIRRGTRAEYNEYQRVHVVD